MKMKVRFQRPFAHREKKTPIRKGKRIRTRLAGSEKMFLFHSSYVRTHTTHAGLCVRRPERHNQQQTKTRPFKVKSFRPSFPNRADSTRTRCGCLICPK